MNLAGSAALRLPDSISSHAPTAWSERVGNSRGNLDRHYRSETERKFPTGDGELTDFVKSALHKSFGSTRFAVKHIAKAANTNMRTAKNWMEGRHAMRLGHFLSLFNNAPEFRAEARRLLALESDMDPSFETALSEFIALALRRGGR